MPPLPVVSSDETHRALERAGWLFVRQEGSQRSFAGRAAGAFRCRATAS